MNHSLLDQTKTQINDTQTEQHLIRKRTQEYLHHEISFISNPEFQFLDSLEEPDRSALLQCDQLPVNSDNDYPAHVRFLCDSEILTADEETVLFRAMNYFKYQANVLRSRLDPQDVKPEPIDQIDALLLKAKQLRDHIIQSNMRLVVSIIKKYVTPQHTFDEMLSDGTMILMNAVEKFDYQRGFRFSTYAYRSIARNAFHSQCKSRREQTHFVPDMEEIVSDELNDLQSSAKYDELWHRMRTQTVNLLNQLDRREKFIIRCRFALGAHRKNRSLQLLAGKLNISKERVRQLEQRAIKKLKRLTSLEEFEASHLF